MFKTLFVYAVNGAGGAGGPLIRNPIQVNSIPEFINKLLEVVVQVGLPVLVLSFVYVGFLFVSARGSDDKLKSAKSAFFTSVIGAAIVLGAAILSAAIQTTITNLK